MHPNLISIFCYLSDGFLKVYKLCVFISVKIFDRHSVKWVTFLFIRISSFCHSIWILFSPSISSLFRKLRKLYASCVLKYFMGCCHIKIMSKMSFQQRCIYSNISWAAVILKSWARYQFSSGLYYSIFFAFASSNSFLCQLLSFFPITFLYSFKGSGDSLSSLAKSIKADFP